MSLDETSPQFLVYALIEYKLILLSYSKGLLSQIFKVPVITYDYLIYGTH